MNWGNVIYNGLVVTVLLILVGSIGFGKPNQVSDPIPTIENELNFIDRRVEMLTEERDRTPWESPRYVDLDKNIGDLNRDIERARISLFSLRNSPESEHNRVRTELRHTLNRIQSTLNSMQAE